MARVIGGELLAAGNLLPLARLGGGFQRKDLARQLILGLLGELRVDPSYTITPDMAKPWCANTRALLLFPSEQEEPCSSRPLQKRLAYRITSNAIVGAHRPLQWAYPTRVPESWAP